MLNTVDSSVIEGPIEVGMKVFRMLPGKSAEEPTIFRYEVAHISSKSVLDFHGDSTRLIWVKDPQGSMWWFYETEFRCRFVEDAILRASA